MQTDTTERATGRRPTHRAWLVSDRPDSDKPLWTELTGLWPTRKGSGLSGNVNKPVTLADGFLMGRLVILPARMRPDQASDGGSAPDDEGGDE